MGRNHPIYFVTSSEVTYQHLSNFAVAFSDFGKSDWKFLENPQTSDPIIGNDVWIGQDVILARGIKLGDGCVVGAGALVTKDVPPFAIVGGNPAQILKYRFPDFLISNLQATKWWEYALPDFCHLPLDDPHHFVSEFRSLVASGKIAKWAPEKESLYKYRQT